MTRPDGQCEADTVCIVCSHIGMGFVNPDLKSNGAHTLLDSTVLHTIHSSSSVHMQILGLRVTNGTRQLSCVLVHSSGLHYFRTVATFEIIGT